MTSAITIYKYVNFIYYITPRYFTVQLYYVMIVIPF